MPSINHLHTYERVKKGGDIFRCIHPDCSHYVRKDLIVGKRSMCYCGEEFILDRDLLKLKRPHCSNCGKGWRLSGSKLAELLNQKPELLNPELVQPEHVHELDMDYNPNQLSLRLKQNITFSEEIE